MGTDMNRVRGRVHVRDILTDLGQTRGSVLFWHRAYVDYISAYLSDIKPTLGPDNLKLLILNDDTLRSLVDSPKEYIEHLIQEISCSYSESILHWLAVITMKILCGTISRFFVSERALETALQSFGDNPVIFLPTHRSYADFILMALVCYFYNIELPCVAAGLDFHSMRGTSYLLRKCKAFFMRRKFSNDDKYRKVFQRYFQNLIIHGESPLEFFIEGTRSRTNKAIYPKMGLLSMAFDVFLSNQVADINIVAVNISYERLLEEHLYVNELLGIPKPKESTSVFQPAMFQAFLNMEEDYGNVLCSFGRPISLRNWMDKYYSYFESEELTKREVLEHLAFHVISDQVRLQGVLPIHILAFVMVSETCLHSKCKLPINFACNRLLYFLRYCEHLKVPVYAMRDYEDVKLELFRICRLHSSVIELKDDIISFKTLSQYKPPNLKKLRRVFDETDVQRLTPFITIQLYVNPMLHVFIGPAIALQTLKPSNFRKKGPVIKLFVKIVDIFKFEFVVLFSVELQQLFSNALKILRSDGIINDMNEFIYSNSVLKDYLKVMLEPFVRGYVNVCATLLQHDKITEHEVIKQTQMLGLKLWKNEELSHPYCLTNDVILNCLKSLVELECITRLQENGVVRYVVVKKKVRNMNRFLAWMLQPVPNPMQSHM